MMTKKVDAVLELTKDKSFVSIREIQKSPSKALDGFKIVLKNWKILGIYIPQSDLDEYAEDLKALSSPKYLDLITKARKEKE